MSALSAPSLREWPNHGSARVPNWVYTDPQIFARELDRIFSASDWLYVCLEAEIPNPGDFKRSPAWHARGDRRPRHGRRNQCPGQPLRASQHAGLHCQPRHREGVRLSLPPVDLRPRRQPDRRAVPSRLSRPGRHARRFPPGGTRAATPRGRRRATAWCSPASAHPTSRWRPISASACWVTSTACSTAASWSCWVTCASVSPATGS